MSFEWNLPPDEAWGGLTEAYVERIRQGVRAIAARRAPEIEAYMRANHLWQNITGAAEAGLHTTVEEVVMETVNIILSHGVSYSTYLEGFTPEGVETMQGGRFAVIAPSVDVFGPIIWRDVQELLGR